MCGLGFLWCNVSVENITEGFVDISSEGSLYAKFGMS